MSDSNKIKTLASALLKELRTTENPDEEALQLLQSLESDLQSVIENQQGSNEIIDLLTNLESRFAVDHPVAESSIRNLIDTLNKMGI